MLKSLKISGLAVIDSLRVDFRPGLNILTGETGSGKSIIVDALGLLLGGRSSTAQIRTGESHASIEGVFQLAYDKQNEVYEVLSELGLERSLSLIILREIYMKGKGRITINGKIVSASALRKLQPFLSEIYGQGEQRSLLSSQSHRDLLDHFGKCDSIRSDVRQLFLRLKTTERELRLITVDLVERERANDYLQHQLAEIDAVNPKSGEEDELLSERKILTHAERITELGSNAYYNLYESDDSIIARLTSLRRQLEELGTFVGETGIAMDSLLTGIASLTDVAETLRRYGTDLDYSPTRLSEIESRLAELEGIKRKYKTDLAGLLKAKDELSGRLSESNEMVERANYLRKEADRLRTDYIKAAKRLSACRLAKAPLLEQKVMEGLRRVAMGQAKFLMSIETGVLEDADADVELHSEDEREEDFSSAFFTAAGADTVEFLLSANPGESPRLLSYVASGGELSRLMLALRTAGQEVGISETVVFDEIDAGIGGQVAEAVGQLLKSLSSSRQVFCVTHQAQIAKYADHHYVVTKLVENSRTQTTIRELAQEERISELSRMIGGDEKAEKTREAAQWLLENAKKTKPKRAKK